MTKVKVIEGHIIQLFEVMVNNFIDDIFVIKIDCTYNAHKECHIAYIHYEDMEEEIIVESKMLEKEVKQP